MDLQYIGKVKLGFSEAILFFNGNLTPYNQKPIWKCRELRRAGEMHSSWSSKDVIKLRHTMNKRASSIEDEVELSNLYFDLMFWERRKAGCIVDTCLYTILCINYFVYTLFLCLCSSYSDLVYLFWRLTDSLLHGMQEQGESSILMERWLWIVLSNVLVGSCDIVSRSYWCVLSNFTVFIISLDKISPFDLNSPRRFKDLFCSFCFLTFPEKWKYRD